MNRTIAFHVNGQQVEVSANPNLSLLTALRGNLDLRATRFGCGAESCGACTVIVDGTALVDGSVPYRRSQFTQSIKSMKHVCLSLAALAWRIAAFISSDRLGLCAKRSENLASTDFLTAEIAFEDAYSNRDWAHLDTHPWGFSRKIGYQVVRTSLQLNHQSRPARPEKSGRRLALKP